MLFQSLSSFCRDSTDCLSGSPPLSPLMAMEWGKGIWSGYCTPTERLWFLIVYCCAGWGYTVAFTKRLTMYHAWIHPLHHSPFSFLPAPIPGRVSAGLIFHLRTCVHSIRNIFTLPPSSLLPLPLLPPSPPGRACSALLGSDFVKGKTDLSYNTYTH
jgi:hypothetical protein